MEGGCGLPVTVEGGCCPRDKSDLERAGFCVMVFGGLLLLDILGLSCVGFR